MFICVCVYLCVPVLSVSVSVCVSVLSVPVSVCVNVWACASTYVRMYV